MLDRDGIAEGLRKLGLAAGDIVLLHSALSSLGPVDGGATAVVEAFLAVLGPRGTLVAPVFGKLGIITETVRQWPRAVVSNHPFACVAAIGEAAEKICADHWRAETAHGPGTPYTRIAEMGGYVCLLGVDQDRNTSLHTVESLLELPYLSDKTGTVETAAGPVEKTWRYFPGPHRDFIGLDRSLRKKGILKIGRIGNAVVRLMKSREMIAHCLEAGRNNPAFALCENPHCQDCQWQRGKIRQARFEQEDFKLAASAGLAGKDVPEIIGSLNSSGISRLELDYLEGIPVEHLPTEKLKPAVRQLREAQVELTALRSTSPQGPVNLRLPEQAARLKIRRIVVPLLTGGGDMATKLLKDAARLGVDVSLYNLGISSQAAAEILLDLANRGLQPGFTFNPVNFTVIREKPFRQSFKSKVKKFIDQLDVSDRTFAGLNTKLAGGNAEIKEMISILRCSTFTGHLVLANDNRATSNLTTTTDQLLHLLDAM